MPQQFNCPNTTETNDNKQNTGRFLKLQIMPQIKSGENKLTCDHIYTAHFP